MLPRFDLLINRGTNQIFKIMRKASFMAGSVGGTAEDRRKANLIGNIVSAVVIAAFITTMVFVTRSAQMPVLADTIDSNNNIAATPVTEEYEKRVLFYTIDEGSMAIVDILEWTAHSYEEIDEFLTALIDSFDDNSGTDFTLGGLYASVFSDNDSWQHKDMADGDITIYTKTDLIKLQDAIRSKA
jgi:hypothetical protein